MQKLNFSHNFKRRNKKITVDLANVFYNSTGRRREGSLNLKENLIANPKGTILLNQICINLILWMAIISYLVVKDEDDDIVSINYFGS